MIRKTLTSIVLAGTFALGGVGCKDNHEYHFNGIIGEEQVLFYEEFFSENYLRVTKADGSVVNFVDSAGNDLKIDCVKITVGDNSTKYCTGSSNPAVTEVIRRAQTEFEAYLAKITELQTATLNRR